MGVHSGGDKVCKLLILKVGERGRNRTFNLLIKSQLLCQLSYAPVCGESLQKGSTIITFEKPMMKVQSLSRSTCEARSSTIRFAPVGRPRQQVAALASFAARAKSR